MPQILPRTFVHRSIIYPPTVTISTVRELRRGLGHRDSRLRITDRWVTSYFVLAFWCYEHRKKPRWLGRVAGWVLRDSIELWEVSKEDGYLVLTPR
jgi:hypothetical protein